MGQTRYPRHVFARARPSPNLRGCEKLARAIELCCRRKTSARRNFDYRKPTKLTIPDCQRIGRPKSRMRRWREVCDRSFGLQTDAIPRIAEVFQHQANRVSGSSPKTYSFP